MSSLSLRDDPPPANSPRRGGKRLLAALIVIVLLLIAGVIGLSQQAWTERQRAESLQQQIHALQAQVYATSEVARRRTQGEGVAAAQAKEATEGRLRAEEMTSAALAEAGTAREQADAARKTAEAAEAEAARIKAKAEADTKRLEAALSQVADTRRTALGLTMNLGSDYLKFEFNKADLRPSDRELLSKVAGILLTAPDYTVSVNGHTDDVGSEAYNQKLSERRAQAVRDYLVAAGLPKEIFSVTGYGKTLPLVKATTDAARQKNRRVELGIAHAEIKYMGVAGSGGSR
jgi:outer membrane protein OmpA-like peptidoglycan-associated protein